MALSVLTQSLPAQPWTRFHHKLKLSWDSLQIVKASSIAISPIVICTSDRGGAFKYGGNRNAAGCDDLRAIPG